MKAPTCFALLAVLSLCGCGSSSDSAGSGSTNTSSSGGSVLTAPVDYLRAAGNAQKTAVKTVETAALNQAIRRFNVEKGRNPKDLNELVQQKFLKIIIGEGSNNFIIEYNEPENRLAELEEEGRI